MKTTVEKEVEFSSISVKQSNQKSYDQNNIDIIDNTKSMRYIDICNF